MSEDFAWPEPVADEQPAATAEALRRDDKARLAAFWDAVASAAQDRARALAAELTAEAREELQRTGTVPTWRIPDFGTVPLSMTKDRVDVVDAEAYVTWVARRYPTEVKTELVISEAFDRRLRAELVKRGDPPCDDQGERVPGVAFVKGGQPKSISLRPDAAAKASAAAAAAVYLDAIPALPVEVTP